MTENIEKTDQTTGKKRFLIIELVRLASSILLIVASIWGWIEYQSSIDQVTTEMISMTKASKETILATKNVLGDTPVALESIDKTIVSSAHTLHEIRDNYQRICNGLPIIQKSFRDVAGDLKTVFSGTKKVGDGINISLPYGLHFEGWKPSLLWGKPLESPSNGLKDIASQLENAGNSVSEIDSGMLAGLVSSSKAVILSLDQTVDSMKNTSLILKKCKGEIPNVVTALKTGEDSLSNVSKSMDRFKTLATLVVVALVCLGLIAGLSSVRHILERHK